MTHTVWIPAWHPARTNELLTVHWAAAGRRKRADKEMVAGYCKQADVLKATGKRRVSLTIVVKPKQRRADPDSHWKSLLDALVACGMLVNDSPKWVELAPVVYERAADWGTRITLEDVANESRKPAG